MSDFKLDLKPNVWVHPETGVRILDEDMPDELRPALVTWVQDVLGVPLPPWQANYLIHARHLAETLSAKLLPAR